MQPSQALNTDCARWRKAWPANAKNIHVAHIVIDGAIDTGFIAVGSAKDGLQVVAKMKETPAEDPVFGRSAVRADGRVIHDFYLFEVKSPAELRRGRGIITS